MQSNFFRQFFRSVRKADYCALRHSFVNVRTYIITCIYIIYIYNNAMQCNAMQCK